MSLARFTKECPGLAGSITRLYGLDAASQLAADYCVAADLGGNVEVGITREEGVSFNPRIARIVSVVIQDCGQVDLNMVRVAVYSSVPVERGGAVPSNVVDDVVAVRDASATSATWVKGISLALSLDRLRHLHMAQFSQEEKLRVLDEVRGSPMLVPDSGAPEALRLKLLHAVELQSRHLSVTGGRS